MYETKAETQDRTTRPADGVSWKLVQGSDDDLALIRQAGYAIEDGRAEK
ncbi:MAG: hypothetical protein ABI353_04985 [Isosphaeraceae bacterium]